MEDDLKDDDELTPEVIDDALEDEEGLDGDIVPKKKKVLDDDVESADDLAEEEDGVEDESYDDTYDQ